MTQSSRAIVLNLATFAVASVGCHAQRRAVAAWETAADTTARGTIRVVGAASYPAIELVDGAHRFVLRGAVQAELSTLDGALVEATGPIVREESLGPNDRAMDVHRYVIDSIAGGVPLVGTLTVRGVETAIDGVGIADPPPALRKLAGAKVWIVGHRSAAGALTVAAFGTLAAPPRSRMPD